MTNKHKETSGVKWRSPNDSTFLYKTFTEVSKKVGAESALMEKMTETDDDKNHRSPK